MAGNVYQAGDRIVTLAPSAGGQLVTSQRGQVTAVDPDAGSLTVRMDDGRTHTLGPDQIGPDQLALGYATTVHRSQGATFDTAHLYADGGGRELGYVAMSRARQTAHVHVVADNIYQAVEDLTWDWSRERRQAWAIDTGTPETQGRHPLEIEADKQAPGKLRAVLSRARLKAERAALSSRSTRPARPGSPASGRRPRPTHPAPRPAPRAHETPVGETAILDPRRRRPLNGPADRPSDARPDRRLIVAVSREIEGDIDRHIPAMPRPDIQRVVWDALIRASRRISHIVITASAGQMVSPTAPASPAALSYLMRGRAKFVARYHKLLDHGVQVTTCRCGAAFASTLLEARQRRVLH